MNVTPPAADIPSGTRFFSGGFFLDRETGWVPYTTSLAGTDSVTGLITTNDGGALWRNISLSRLPVNTGIQLDFVSRKVGWLLVSLTDTMAVGSVDLYRTTNGGMTWSPVSSVDRSTGSAKGAVPFVGYKSISFLSQSVGYLTGSNRTMGLQSVYLYRTSDGGHMWQRLSLPRPIGYNPAAYEMTVSAPVFFSGGTGVLILRGASPGRSPSVITTYVTTDRGTTWKPGEPFFVQTATRLSFVTARIGFALVGKKVYGTQNSGNRWRVVSSNPPAQPHFLDRMSWWAWTSSPQLRIWHTNDGGAVWASSPISTAPAG